MDKKIINIIFGIRFLKSFGVLDKTGQIIDNILYDDKSPFKAQKIFSDVQEISTREKLLLNKEGEYLRINESDLIFKVFVKENFEEKMKWIQNEVLEYFAKYLFKKFEIKNFVRLGIVFNHKIEAESKEKEFNDFVKNLTKSKIVEAEGLSLSFNTKRLSAFESLYRKEVKDFRNTIYTINKEKSFYLFSLDYQYCFEPYPEDFRDCLVDKFLDSSKNFLKKSFYEWL